MRKVIIEWLLKTPAIALMALSVIAGFVAVAKETPGVKIYVPITVLIILALYIVGEFMHSCEPEN